MGLIRKESNYLICEYFLDEEVEIIKRQKLSYLSNEKYNWKKEKIRINNIASLKGLSPLFYEKLYSALKLKKDFEITVDSVIETMKVIDHIIIKTK